MSAPTRGVATPDSSALGLSRLGAPTLGVIVPCRDEAHVIERKLRNLARVEWPSAQRVHRVVVVDDGSEDATADLARRAAAQHFSRASPASVEVVANDGAPGKAGAIACGLARLGAEVDVLVLTDADVIFERRALLELAGAFVRDPRLGLACAAQRFVRELGDGDPRVADDLRASDDDAGLYDRWTALVRRAESRCGRLFSVHGQLLAWRRELGLAATPGIAADDIDLRMQARARGARVELIPSARFLEVKAPSGEARRAQELRRARAFVQCVTSAHVAALVARTGRLDRIQFACYRRLPLSAPWLVASGLVAAPLAAYALGAPKLALGLVAAALVLAVSPLGRRFFKLCAVIVRATWTERRESLPGTWRTARR